MSRTFPYAEEGRRAAARAPNWYANAAALCAVVLTSSAFPVAMAASRRPDGSYPFETVSVLLLAEALKLAIAAACLLRECWGLAPAERRDKSSTLAPVTSTRRNSRTICCVVRLRTRALP